MTCRYATLDAGYVLGALSPAERSDYERHLRDCEECSRAVRELAGLPGLLAKVPADVLESPPTREPVPATLLPALVKSARRDQRRRVVRTSLVAAAAVAVMTGGAVATTALMSGDDGPPAVAPPVSVATTAPPQRLTPVGPGGSSGWVSLTSVAWGTRLDLTCTYESWREGGGPWTYTMVVVGTDGEEQVAGTWDALPGKALHVTGAAAMQPDDIAMVEVRTSDGDAVLRLTD